MDMSLALPFTTYAAILNGGLLVAMTAAIGVIRNRRKLSFGDAGDGRLAKRIRGHGNAVEQIPIALILLAVTEFQGASDTVLWIVAAGLTIGRYFHATQFWISGAPFLLRPVGVVLTLTAQAVAILWLLGQVLS